MTALAHAGGAVMLIQHGARRNYVAARQLNDAGLLSRLVCDAAWSEQRPGFIYALAARVAPGLGQRLARRRVAGLAPDRLSASVLPNLAQVAKRIVHEERAFALIDEVQGWVARARGLGETRAVVSCHGNGGAFLRWAKARGARIAVDFVITPKYLEIERDEQARWPGWETAHTPDAVIAFYRRRMAGLVSLADRYFCPSPAVARDLADLQGFDPAKVRLTPYGLSGVLLRPARPEAGRILFAGAAGLRKGLPYLAQAATLLKARGVAAQAVVAGLARPSVRERAETGDLTFLGVLDRERMSAEFARADVFCLPSLAEGSATVVFEALAHGVPVVTTAASGSVVTDGVEGFVVPERDAKALADGLARIVGDRDLREAMSAAALATAARYSDAACGEIFVAAVRDMIADGAADRS